MPLSRSGHRILAASPNVPDRLARAPRECPFVISGCQAAGIYVHRGFRLCLSVMKFRPVGLKKGECWLYERY